MGDATIARKMPKVHLHCHLEGTLRAATFVELADRHGVPLRYRPQGGGTLGASFAPAAEAVDRERPYRFANFSEFLLIFAAISRSLREPDDYARLAREFVEDALAQNVIYGELFVSPSVWTFFNPALDVRAALDSIAAELRAARPRATFSLLPDLTRNFGPERAMATARMMVSMTDLDIVGISLGGDEARYPASLFADAFAYARAQGLRCVAHAGETDGPQSIRDAIELLGAERIGHGITALNDDAMVDLLARRRTPLEICPTSNARTGAALPGYRAPYVDLDRRGCVVTIDCDDPAIFETSIEAEYALVEGVAGPVALERFVRNAIAATFAGVEAKRSMESRLDAALAELRPPVRS